MTHHDCDMSASILPSPQVPDRVSPDGLEERWAQAWEDDQVYAFNPDTTREQVFSIDTPPPTASGSLHVGHVFSYTHTDVLARYQRMRGRNVFYPMGWDDNGLPTERRAQNYYGVRCDPSLDYDPDFTPPHHGDAKSVKASDQVPVSRRNFIELCEQLTVEDEKQFEALWRRLGLSVDWSHSYQTIGTDTQKVAQWAFLKNLERGEAYQQAAPGLWDVTFHTAVAQAEVESREYPGDYHALAFDRVGAEGSVVIETTRPELLAACCCLVAHPDDERYQHLFGTTVTSPGFNVELPVLAHPAAEQDKGAGIAMCCTFGDVTDVTWWRDLDLPTRVILGHDGRILAETPEWITDEGGRALYAATAGKTTFAARAIVVEALKANEHLIGDPKPTLRQANFFEKGNKPLEIVMSRQWYIRNGGTDYTREGASAPLREELLARGQELSFHPDFMKVRYANWVSGLNTDWLISRQRFFGVPIPVWYEVDDAGEPNYDRVIVPDLEQLPIDPTTDVPAGYTADQRDVAGGFTGEKDIMDTWATSSLTPQIVAGWLRDETLFANVYPMDVRPQGQDIIRTWLFSTLVRAHLEFDALPWKHAAISGWILDPDRKKMSKSKGNVVTPMALLEKHGSDAVRYWAAAARLGTDTAFEEQQMKIGRRLAMKLLNASKFALAMGGQDHPISLDPAAVTVDLDRAVLAALTRVVDTATLALERFDHTRALEVTEAFFWSFCDNYLELVKDRANNFSGNHDDAEVASARSALALVVDTVTRLLAPYLPFAAEEVWSWYRTGSVHRAPWPDAANVRNLGGDEELLETAGQALSVLRKIKSEAKVSQRTPIEAVTVHLSDADAALIERARGDLTAAAKITGTLTLVSDRGEDEPMATSGATLGEAPAKRPRR